MLHSNQWSPAGPQSAPASVSPLDAATGLACPMVISVAISSERLRRTSAALRIRRSRSWAETLRHVSNPFLNGRKCEVEARLLGVHRDSDLLPVAGPEDQQRLAAAGRSPGAVDEEVDLGIHDDLVFHWDRWAAAAGWALFDKLRAKRARCPYPIRLGFLSVMVGPGLHRNAMTAIMRVRRVVWSNPWCRPRALR
jgi:hypothetical protein